MLIPRPSHPLVGDLLPRLDARLVEGVDAVQRPGYRRLYFEGLEHVAQVLLVRRAELYGRVGVAGLGEGPARGVALDVEEFGHGMSPEVADAFEVVVGFGYRQVPRMVLDLDDLDHLVLGALHVELDLRVLVRGADCAVRCGAFAILAQRLRPELHEPGREPLQRVGVGHHDPDVAPPRGVHEIVHRRPDDRRVLRPLLVDLVHALRSPREQGVDVERGHGSGKQSDRREDREPPAHIGGYGEDFEVFTFGYLLEESLVGVGSGDNTALEPEGPQRVDEHAPDHEEVGHGLGRRARLGDDVDVGPFGVGEVEDGRKRRGVRVLREVHAWAATVLAREGVVERMAQRLVHGHRTQCRPPDADVDEVRRPRIPYLLGDPRRSFGVLRGLRQPHEARRVVEKPVRGLTQARPYLVQLPALQPAFHLYHVLVVEGDLGHARAPLFRDLSKGQFRTGYNLRPS